MLALLPVAILAVFVACTFAPFLAMGHGRHVPALLSGQAALSVVLMGTAALCSDLGPSRRSCSARGARSAASACA
jgi:hypothetical protein